MIAQILSRGRRGRAASSRSTNPSDESRAFKIGVRCVRVLLAILLLPALATVLIIGGLGAVVVGLATAAGRLLDAGERPSSS